MLEWDIDSFVLYVDIHIKETNKLSMDLYYLLLTNYF